MSLPTSTKMLDVGDEVYLYWTDPEGITSAFYIYTIVEICTESGTIDNEYDVVKLQNPHSETEAYASELS
jgi:hypothetical protein